MTLFAHYDATLQKIVQPLSTLKLENNTGVTDDNTLWVDTSNGHLKKGLSDLQNGIYTDGSQSMTPSGVTALGTFTFTYTKNGNLLVGDLVQAASVNQQALASKLVFSNALASDIRPERDLKIPLFLRDNVLETSGHLIITAAGAMTVGVGTTGNFSGLGTMFVHPINISYMV